MATFYLVLLQNWPRAGKEKAKGAFNLRSSCEIRSIFKKAIYSTQSLSAHHTHLPIYISPFHFLSFLSSKVSQAMCSRENSLGQSAEQTGCHPVPWLVPPSSPAFSLPCPLPPFSFRFALQASLFSFTACANQLLKMTSRAAMIRGRHCSHNTLVTVTQLRHQMQANNKEQPRSYQRPWLPRRGWPTPKS